MMKSQRKFKNFIINPKFQFHYIFWTSTAGLLLIALNDYVFYHFTKENYMLLVELSPMTDEAKQQLFAELNKIIFLLGGFSILFLIIVLLVGVIFSHRVAGPLYKMKLTFNRIKNGERDLRVFFRPKDDFKDVAQSCNEMLDSLQEKKK